MSETPITASDAVDATASVWMARRDRGLTASEQDEYLQWRSRDPRHSAAVAKLEKAWSTLDSLAVWRPEHSPRPNPDLLARRTRGSRWFFAGSALTAALITLLLSLAPWRGSPVSAPATLPVQAAQLATQSYDRQRLDDGSVVELNSGASLSVQFSTEERRVELVRGEAHFTVAKDPTRPFVVRAGKVAIRAIGTAFNVRLQSASVEVLVTEGKVHVEEPAAPIRAEVEQPLVIAGQRAVISTSETALQSVIAEVTPQQISRALSWQPKRLEFADTPLVDAIEQFNQLTSCPLVLGDHDLGAMRIGGTFRADNVDAFVRLLESGFGLTVERHEDRITLRHAH